MASAHVSSFRTPLRAFASQGFEPPWSAVAAVAPPGAQAPCWELFAHGADMGVRGWGRTKAEAFEEAGRALTAVMTDPAQVRGRSSITLQCQAVDDERLLLAWLNRLVTEMSLRGMLFSGFRVALQGCELRARVVGERISQPRHHPAVEIRRATATELRVLQRADGLWIAQTVVDV